MFDVNPADIVRLTIKVPFPALWLAPLVAVAVDKQAPPEKPGRTT